MSTTNEIRNNIAQKIARWANKPDTTIYISTCPNTNFPALVDMESGNILYSAPVLVWNVLVSLPMYFSDSTVMYTIEQYSLNPLKTG